MLFLRFTLSKLLCISSIPHIFVFSPYIFCLRVHVCPSFSLSLSLLSLSLSLSFFSLSLLSLSLSLYLSLSSEYLALTLSHSTSESLDALGSHLRTGCSIPRSPHQLRTPNCTVQSFPSHGPENRPHRRFF